MDMKNRLWNTLVRNIQQLSTEKLTEISDLLYQIENQFKSKEETLKLDGTWKDLSDDAFIELTENLRDLRSKDHQIN
jgi:hypothetical protein